MNSTNSQKNELNKICSAYLKRSNTMGFIAISSNWGKILLIIWLIKFIEPNHGIFWVVVYFFTSIYSATIYRGFENLTHEASHYNLFANKKWNNSLQWLFAFPVFKNIYDYRHSHMQHHAHLGSSEKDPDLIMYAEWGLTILNSSNFIRLILIKPFYYSLYFYIKNSFLIFWKNDKLIYSKLIFWVSALCLVWFTNTWIEFILIFIIPFFGILPIIRFWCEVSEHIGFDLTKYLPNSRNNIGLLHSVMYPFNDGYHQIHHIAPYVPWYLLPKLHKMLKEYSIYNDNVQNSYSIIRSFWLMFKSSTITKK